MLKCGILGVGNAGNQVVSYAASVQAPFNLLAMNCSSEDLRMVPDSVPRLVIGDGRGAGKNRSESKTFLSEDVTGVIKSDCLKNFLTDLDVVFVVSSTGGGTGSGISLLLSTVMKNVFPTIYTIPIGIMGTLKEALSTHSNTLEYLKELYENMKDTTYMLYDNEKFAKLPSNQMMERVNKQIVDDLVVLTGYYNHNTKYSSIDDRDMLNIIRTPGRLVIGSVINFKEKDINEKSIEKQLLENIKTSGSVDLQKDRIVNRLGVIANITEPVSEQFDTTVPEVQKEVGSPVENFEHISIIDDTKLPNSVYLILSGCTQVNDRINQINDRVSEILERQNQKEDDDALSGVDVAALNAKKVYKKPVIEEKQVDLGNIFSQFGVDLK